MSPLNIVLYSLSFGAFMYKSAREIENGVGTPLPKQKTDPCSTLRKEGTTVIFAKGELYCYAVIFGLRPSYIRFASFWGEYNITETASFNITL